MPGELARHGAEAIQMPWYEEWKEAHEGQLRSSQQSSRGRLRGGWLCMLGSAAPRPVSTVRATSGVSGGKKPELTLVGWLEIDDRDGLLGARPRIKAF